MHQDRVRHALERHGSGRQIEVTAKDALADPFAKHLAELAEGATRGEKNGAFGTAGSRAAESAT